MTITSTPGATNANSYVDMTYAEGYFTTRIGSDDWMNAAPEVREAVLIQSTTLLDSLFTWSGDRNTEEQSLRWPREYAYDADGYEIANTVIPENVKKAQCEMAIFLISNGGYLGQSRDVDRLRLGSIMLDFDNSAAALPIPNIVTELLRGFGAYSGSGKSGNICVPVVRV